MTTLICDGNYLGHAAKHSMPRELSFRELPTGIIFGFLTRILSMAEWFETNRFIFCWDSRRSLRRESYRQYKGNRAPSTPAEKKEMHVTRQQFVVLRKRILPRIGFKNNLLVPGYEADDLMAWQAECSRAKGKVVIVTADTDMYQCIRPGIVVWNPSSKIKMTMKRFRETYGIDPLQWGMVKSIMGCPSDNIRGVEGVGIKTALKYVQGQLAITDTKAVAVRQSKKLIERNKCLIDLPYLQRFRNNVPFPPLQQDKLSMVGLKRVARKYNLRSVLTHADRWRRMMAGVFEGNE